MGAGCSDVFEDDQPGRDSPNNIKDNNYQREKFSPPKPQSKIEKVDEFKDMEEWIGIFYIYK